MPSRESIHYPLMLNILLSDTAAVRDVNRGRLDLLFFVIIVIIIGVFASFKQYTNTWHCEKLTLVGTFWWWGIWLGSIRAFSQSIAWEVLLYISFVITFINESIWNDCFLKNKKKILVTNKDGIEVLVIQSAKLRYGISNITCVFPKFLTPSHIL